MKNKKIISLSPFADKSVFDPTLKEQEIARIRRFIKSGGKAKVVVVQGLGFVGAAMLTAIADAKTKSGRPLYRVIGVDLPLAQTYWKIDAINKGRLPIKSSDKNLMRIFRRCLRAGNIIATPERYAYEAADIIVVSINFDIKKAEVGKAMDSRILLDKFRLAMKDIAGRLKPGALVIIESTVPPGTCEKILIPLFKREFKKRGIAQSKVNLAYSYERVMPGKNYLRSITAYYRVFSAANAAAAAKTRKFLESFIDTKSYPLTELENTTAAEIGKVLENSYRAVNIAFIQEWTELAEAAGINLFEVISGIKKRPTHNNIMLPGFGVGGYCLPKDPLLADWGKRRLCGSSGYLPVSVEAVNINDKMPLYSFELLKKNLKNIKNKEILLMGVSYLKDVVDTRYSPSEIFYRTCLNRGLKVSLHDPIVNYWPEFAKKVVNDLDAFTGHRFDAVVLALNHDEYLKMGVLEFKGLLKPRGLILDCNNVVSDNKAKILRRAGLRVAGVGKGHWLKHK